MYRHDNISIDFLVIDAGLEIAAGLIGEGTRPEEREASSATVNGGKAHLGSEQR